MNQQDHDLRSLAWHTHVVERMREDPELMQKALAIGTRWLALGPRRSDVYTRAWVELLRQGIDAVAEVATSSTERATAMRQSSPVACVLGREERNAFWAAWSPKEPPEPPTRSCGPSFLKFNANAKSRATRPKGGPPPRGLRPQEAVACVPCVRTVGY